MQFQASCHRDCSSMNTVVWVLIISTLLTNHHVCAGGLYCSTTEASWVQAVNNCAQLGGQLVSSVVLNSSQLSDDESLSTSLHLHQGQRKWIGNFLSITEVTPFDVSARPGFLNNYVCGTVKIAQVNISQDNKLRTYIVSQSVYRNCSDSLMVLCGRDTDVFANNFTLQTWDDVKCKTKFLRLDNGSRFSRRHSALNQSLFYWTNKVAKLKWNTAPAQVTSTTEPALYRCGSMTFGEGTPHKSDCDDKNLFVCRINTLGLGEHTGFKKCHDDVTSTTGPTSLAPGKADAVSTTSLAPGQTDAFSTEKTTVDNQTTSNNHADVTETMVLRNDNLASSASGRYIGISVVCLVAVVTLVAVVVLVKRRRARARRTHENPEDFKNETPHPAATIRENMAYDSNHGLGQLRNDPSCPEPNDEYSQPFDQAVPPRGQRGRADVRHDALYSFTEAGDLGQFEDKGDYSTIKKNPNTSADRNQDVSGNYDHIGQLKIRNVGKGVQSDNTYDKLACDGNNVYGTRNNRNPKLAAVDNVYDHVTKEEDSVYSSTSAPTSVSRDPLYDHT